MKKPRNYSALLSTLHDETGPVGNIGRGCHYSVFRVPQWFDRENKPSKLGLVQDFAVIWDEDHDERVIHAIEELHMAGLLAPVVFIGERKGNLTVLVNYSFFGESSDSELKEYIESVEAIAGGFHSDYWPAHVGYFDGNNDRHSEMESIIASDKAKSDNYLRTIFSLWSLGIKKFDADSHSYQAKAFNNEQKQRERERNNGMFESQLESSS